MGEAAGKDVAHRVASGEPRGGFSNVRCVVDHSLPRQGSPGGYAFASASRATARKPMSRRQKPSGQSIRATAA